MSANMIGKVYEALLHRYNHSSSERFIKYLRKIGCHIGEGCKFYSPEAVSIDITRPCLIHIGNKVRITKGVVILTHGADWHVLREVYHETLGSAGKVTIKDNVFIGFNSIILKGVTIHENVIIGAGSVVTKDIPPMTVAAGNPAKPIMGIDEYRKKREQRQLQEAFEYAHAIKERYNRTPVPDDFKEFFHLFLERDPAKFGNLPVNKQVGDYYDDFLRTKPHFSSFEDFLKECRLK